MGDEADSTWQGDGRGWRDLRSLMSSLFSAGGRIQWNDGTTSEVAPLKVEVVRPGKEARETVERAIERFGLSRTLTKKIAAAVLDEFMATTGRAPDGSVRLVLMRDLG